MYDQETNSLWSHLLGEAMSGKLKGTRLTQIPSVMTDWASFRDAHPLATVVMLRRTSQEFTNQIYRPRKRYVLGIAHGNEAKSWNFENLEKSGVVHDQWVQRPIVIMFDRPSVTPRMYRAELDGRRLSFALERRADVTGIFIDQQTKSIWNPVSGLATAGPLKGKFLQPLPAIVSFDSAWKTFHPQRQ